MTYKFILGNKIRVDNIIVSICTQRLTTSLGAVVVVMIFHNMERGGPFTFIITVKDALS